MALCKIPGLGKSDGVVFPTIPADIYKARVVNVEQKESGAKSEHPGRPYLNFTLKIIDNANVSGNQFHMVSLPAEDMNEEEKRRAVASLKRMAIACGVEAEDDQIDTQDFIGQELTAVITEETKDGEKRNRVKDVRPVDE